jgi:hypothetical protein
LNIEAASLVFAIPNHPWVESSDGAAVRIAMTVAIDGKCQGQLWTIAGEKNVENQEEAEIEFTKKSGKINADLSIGADVTSSVPLRAGEDLNSFGMMLAGSGFIITHEKAIELGWGKNPEVSKY